VGQRMRSLVPHETPTVVVAGAMTTIPAGHVVKTGVGARQPLLILVQPVGHEMENWLRTHMTPLGTGDRGRWSVVVGAGDMEMVGLFV